MSESFFKGAANPQDQKWTYKYSPVHGFNTVYEYRGLSQGQMYLLFQDFIRNGIESELVYEHDTAYLSANDSTSEYTLDTWQIVGSSESKSLFAHPSMLQVATPDQITQMRSYLEANVPASSVFTDEQPCGPTGIDGPCPGLDAIDLTDLFGTYADFLYELIAGGQSEYRIANYVLRHTTNVSNQWQSNVADFGVNQIYTPAQLLSEISSAALWILPCPARLQYKISNIPSLPFVENFQWGWLKSPSTETSAANNRVDITTDYALDLWSTIVYPPY